MVTVGNDYGGYDEHGMTDVDGAAAAGVRDDADVVVVAADDEVVVVMFVGAALTDRERDATAAVVGGVAHAVDDVTVGAAVIAHDVNCAVGACC